MWIAISQRNDKNKHGLWIDNLENNYIDFFEPFGAKLLTIPNVSKNIKSYFDEYEIFGVVLSGGNDVNPKLYGEKTEKNLSISVNRDETENKLIKIALDKKLPIFGICKGMQHLNVYFKGKLIRDLGKEIKKGITHVKEDHVAEIIDERAKKIFGKEMKVNSYHNQGIISSTLSKDLIPFAVAPDGVIEGFYHKSLPIAGVQWHPERNSPNREIDSKIVKMFLNKKFFWEK